MKLIIKNIGPVAEAELDIKAYNFIIGEQGEGKSTIAKILSFCLWLEKYLMMEVDQKELSEDFYNQNLEKYHKMESYFNKDSYISYVGNYINFTLKDENYEYEVKKKFSEYKKGKTAYIPAERIILSLSNISKYLFQNDYIKDFVFEWLDVRTNFTRSSWLDFDTLGYKYYYDNSIGDMLEFNDSEKNMPLTNASSGMQAITPVYVYLYYLLYGIYNGLEKVSFDKKKYIYNAITRIVSKELNIHNIEEISNNLSKEGNSELASKFDSVLFNIGKYHNTSVVIEEPEISLFPTTQINFIKKTMPMINRERGDILFMTTHSPYILSAVNNSLMAGYVVDKYPALKKKISEAIPNMPFIFPQDCSVYSIGKKINGGECCKSIIDRGMIDFNALDNISYTTSEEFETLSDMYLEEIQNSKQ